MTNAAVKVAGQVPHGESERGQTATEVGETLPATSSHLPVFAAFIELGFTGRDIAAFVGVTAPTVSKWRVGKARIPGERLAFVTLALAHLLDEAPKTRVGQPDWPAKVSAARAYLAYQDVLNRELAVGDVREGAQLFRAWWSCGAAQRLQDKRFTADLAGEEEQNMRDTA